MFRRVSGAVLALVAAAAVAQPPPREPATRAQSQLAAPRGPIKITAARAELERQDTAIYRGNVRLVSPDVELAGDHLELRQPAKGQFEARLTGRPAQLRHKPPGDAPPVSASASRIFYDTRRATIDLMGGALLERGTDTVRSETIRYDLAARRISASGVGNGQVEIVIQPPPQGEVGQPMPDAAPQKPQNTTAPTGTPPSE